MKSKVTGPVIPTPPDRNAKRPKLHPLVCGTMFHYLCEIQGGTLDHRRELGEDFDAFGFKPEWDKAVEMYSTWSTKYANNFWGKTVSREESFPRNENEEKILFDAFGVKFTMRTDWTTYIDKVCSRNINMKFPHLDIPPGKVIHDYKTADKKESDPQSLYNNSPQGFAYPTAYNLLHDDDPCVGIIYHRVIKTKETNFQHTFVPATDRNAFMTQAFLRNAELLRKTDLPLGVAHACSYKFSQCEFSEMCNKGVS